MGVGVGVGEGVVVGGGVLLVVGGGAEVSGGVSVTASFLHEVNSVSAIRSAIVSARIFRVVLVILIILLKNIFIVIVLNYYLCGGLAFSFQYIVKTYDMYTPENENQTRFALILRHL